MRSFAILALALTLGAASPRPVAPVFVQPLILMYHRVDPERPIGALAGDLTVTPRAFAQQLDYLKTHDIAVLSMEQLVQRLRLGQAAGRAAVITFDDGYEDQYRYAVPALFRAHESATFYIVTGSVGHGAHLTWPQLRAMVAEHMDIGGHGLSHDDLATMSAARQAVQIVESVNELRTRLQTPVDSYAYPSGRLNRETLRIVPLSGVSLAVTTDPAYVIRPQNRFELTRLRVHGRWSIADFAAAVSTALAHPVPIFLDPFALEQP